MPDSDRVENRKGFCYASVVPWGRSFAEYRAMFSLTDADLQKRILGCGDGPAGFNHAMHVRGGRVISVDPVYSMTAGELSARIDETFENVISQTRQNQDKFVWNTIRSVDELGEVRMAAMREFLADFEDGKTQGRCVPGSVPDLPFADKEFDLALSSHFLFLYTDNLSYGFHVDAIMEMLRVSDEVRIFPLLDVNANPSPYVEDMVAHFSVRGFFVEETDVNYEFQRNGNRMLVLRRTIPRA